VSPSRERENIRAEDRAFVGSSRYYDLLYRNKDYDSEVVFVLKLAEALGVRAKRVLDVGCGTGGHLIPLAKRGLEVTGFDLSDQMVAVAREKIARNLGDGVVKVQQGDATTYTDGAHYDLILSMFAAMGYLSNQEAFMAGLKMAARHLGEAGIFIFDVWYGPGVLNICPETRIQELHDGDTKVLRIAQPLLDSVKQVVNVDYTILAFNTRHGTYNETREKHVMRYFFLEELSLMLRQAGLRLKSACPFMDFSRAPSDRDWNITVVAEHVGDEQ